MSTIEENLNTLDEESEETYEEIDGGSIEYELNRLRETKTAIRQAIAQKGQTITDTDPFFSYAGKISAIQTGPDTSDATAAVGDIASGKTAYVNGQKVTGNVSVTSSGGIVNTLASTAEVSEVTGPDKKKYVQTSAAFSYDGLIRAGGKVTTTALAEKFGSAAAADVLAGKTFTSAAGMKVIGTMKATNILAGFYGYAEFTTVSSEQYGSEISISLPPCLFGSYGNSTDIEALFGAFFYNSSTGTPVILYMQGRDAAFDTNGSKIPGEGDWDFSFVRDVAEPFPVLYFRSNTGISGLPPKNSKIRGFAAIVII